MTNTRPEEVRTLFFNFAHEDFADKAYFFIGGGKRYRLTKVSDHPHVLTKARETNAFLRGVPDDQITHHLEGAVFATDTVTLAYVGADIDKKAGTWSMSSTNFIIPTPAVAHAYAMARQRVPNGPLPHGAKRRTYKLPPATTQKDMAEEAALLDPIDHASTLVGLHPDLLSREPNSASHIYQNHVNADQSGDIAFLAQAITQKGPALPQHQQGQQNPSGWGTLTPLTTDDGSPIKNPHTNRIQYLPDWNSEIDSLHATAVANIHPNIKNDESLGADVTGVDPLAPAASLQGKIWARHDGTTSVVYNGQAALASGPLTWDYQQKNGEAGLVVTSPTVTVQADGSVQITLNNVSNWFLRFLGMWLQCLDANRKVIPATQLPHNLIPSRQGQPSSLDKNDALFVGIVSPAFTVAGIPVYPGQTSVTLQLPPDTNIQTVKVLYAGFGGSGCPPLQPDAITPVGVGLTLTVNYGLVSVFMAVGVSNIDPVIKVLGGTTGQILAGEILNIIGADVLVGGTGIPILPAIVAFLKGLLNGLAGKGLVPLVQAMLTQMAAAEIIDSVPVSGQIARAVAAVVGGIQLAETSLEVALSPPVYAFDLSLTHDVTFNMFPDKTNNQFPAVPPGYALYYTVTYLFDNGLTPHVIPPVDVPDPTVKHLPVTIQGIPRGGKITVSVGFYARASSTPPSQNDWCAGKGTTGLQSNDVDTLPDFHITQTKIPITPTTHYVHTRKTALDQAGKHLWIDTATAPPYVAPTGGQQPGDLGALRSITVRQGTATHQGYVGYSWQAYSSGLPDCSNKKARGQLDQAANLNTDASNEGANAQRGYATTPCALQGGATSGVKLAYNLLTQDTANIYLDTSSLHVRPVSLGDPPSFAPPASGQSFGQLNLDSTRLLLHPAGHLVSINNENHKIETLKLQASAMADATATKYFLARTHSGLGSRPGLITSPAALGVSPDGVILVLEDASANNRIQAFDLGGNPVPYFKEQPKPYFLELDSTPGQTYLDLAVEFTGYLYVLSQDSNHVFRLDIYHPAQTDTTPICTTLGVNAARLAVDFWRHVYTLNYEVLQLPGGGYPDITEPSVSLWLGSDFKVPSPETS